MQSTASIAAALLLGFEALSTAYAAVKGHEPSFGALILGGDISKRRLNPTGDAPAAWVR